MRLLKSGDAKVRSAAAQLLAFLPPRIEALSAALLAETDDQARYSVIFALGMHRANCTVPDPKKKDVRLSVMARMLRQLHGGPADTTLLTDANNITKLKEDETFPGGNSVNVAVGAVRVRSLWQRFAPDELTAGDNAFALIALWPNATTPQEPRGALTERERAWLTPLYAQLTTGWPRVPWSLFPRYGLLHGVGHIRRLLGLESGAADDIWLAARRVVDERATIDAWIAAIRDRDVVAVVLDLDTYATAAPWPTILLPNTPTPAVEARARYYKLLRATLATLHSDRLGLVANDDAEPIRAAALAVLVERGVPIGATDVEQRLAFVEYDADTMRTLLRALPGAECIRLLGNVKPEYTLDPIYRRPRLTGLWQFAELLPTVDRLIDHLASTVAMDESLTSPKNDKQRADGDLLRATIQRDIRALGPRAIEPLQDALAKMKRTSKARATVELALEVATASGQDS